MSIKHLPIALVSAADTDAAKAIISELLDKQVGDVENENPHVIWQLENKYYTAEVQLQAVTDSPSGGDAHGDYSEDCVEAHIIYLTENESWVEVAAVRLQRGSRASVRLVLVEACEVPAALSAWALAARYEPVPLREPADPADPTGIERARMALHAHPWRGLVRVGRSRYSDPTPITESQSDSSDGEGLEEDPEAVVERAERFAAALGALSSATAQSSQLADSARLDAAEELVAAFCRALGYDLDAC